MYLPSGSIAEQWFKSAHYCFESLLRLYPGGIPKSLIEEMYRSMDISSMDQGGGGEVSSQKGLNVSFEGADTPRLLVLIISSEDSYLQSEEGKLLQAALEKGMNLAASDYAVGVISPDTLAHASYETLYSTLGEELLNKKPAAVLLPGTAIIETIQEGAGLADQLQAGVLIDFFDIPTMITEEISDVLKKQEVKKKFWGQLQTLMKQVKL